MATKILKGAGKLLGIGKKKSAEPAAVEQPSGPIITPLGEAAPLDPRRRRAQRPVGLAQTILSDKLGA